MLEVPEKWSEAKQEGKNILFWRHCFAGLSFQQRSSLRKRGSDQVFFENLSGPSRLLQKLFPAPIRPRTLQKKIRKKEGADLTFSRLLLPFFQTAFEVPFSFIIFRSGEGKASAGCEAKVREGKFAFKFSSFFAVEEEENRARGFFFQTKRQILFSLAVQLPNREENSQ